MGIREIFGRRVCLLAAVAIAAGAWGDDASRWDTYPDTWVAVDALGRELPTHEDVGAPREDRYVAIFYHTWHGHHTNTGPHDITKILADHPNAMADPDHPAWGPSHHYHHWGEPLFGYYNSTDEWVYRRHGRMLAGAGVDVVIFDATNNFIYEEETLALCRAFAEVRENGGDTPQIAFMTPFVQSHNAVERLYESFYEPGKYEQLWFRWEGKPLVLANPDSIERAELLDFFTFRLTQPSYFDGPIWPPDGVDEPRPDMWSWLEVYPQHVFRNSAGEAEMMSAGIAQNAVGDRLAAFSEPGARGRSWRDGQQDRREDAAHYGLNFQEQWDRALEVDPKLVYVCGWNEWTAMRMSSFNQIGLPVMFVDKFSMEYSRDAEPMRGGFGDAYYLQLISNIRRYKGVRSAPMAGPPRTIYIDGGFEQWESVAPEFRDAKGDTAPRNHPGVGDAHYVNETGRNDFVLMKTAHDADYIYFYAQTAGAISPHTDPHWMMLFLNTDGGYDTGWHGYNFVLNRTVIDGRTGLLEWNGGVPGHEEGAWAWRPAAQVRFRVEDNEMMAAVPRWALQLEDVSAFTLDFKWSDNFMALPCEESKADGGTADGVAPDILDFYVSGDAAPDGRFNYRYRVEE